MRTWITKVCVVMTIQLRKHRPQMKRPHNKVDNIAFFFMIPQFRTNKPHLIIYVFCTNVFVHA